MKLTIIAVCHNSQGFPDFASTTVEVNDHDRRRGEHYAMAKECFIKQGFEAPFVLFDPNDLETLLWGKIKQSMQETFA